jgi:DNA-binding NtrC family response regulator
MRPEELDHRELLDLDTAGGTIRFAGQRALLMDAVAMGLLRKYLVENFGLAAARTVLTQFGFAHGWRMADAMGSGFAWDSDADWRLAGTRIHALEGLFKAGPGSGDPLSGEGVTLADSYEAEQHLLHFGRSEGPVCWTVCGLVSGYISRTAGQELHFLEDRCLGMGDTCCHLVGHTREDWGDRRADELMAYQPERLHECLDLSQRQVAETLKVAERKLEAYHRVLGQGAREIGPMDLVARSPAMRKLLDLARRVAKVDATVLITGESGSGKERVARLIHDHSTRLAGPFVAVNCGAIAETLLESELFGHARGAFTGATQHRAGLFEAAEQGTLLLDEIGDISPGMQVMLLRVLQEREIRRVGENKGRPVDVRILAATHHDLHQAVASGAFRKDLYYRLNVVELHVPPLRERREDILPLARVLLERAAVRMRRVFSGIAPAAADQLLRYRWPGNVRELENTMERAVALAAGTRVELEDLPEEIRQASALPLAAAGALRPLEVMEKEYILAALALNGGNQTHTARQLRIGAATLYRKLKSYGMVGGDGTGGGLRGRAQAPSK